MFLIISYINSRLNYKPIHLFHSRGVPRDQPATSSKSPGAFREQAIDRIDGCRCRTKVLEFTRVRYRRGLPSRSWFIMPHARPPAKRRNQRLLRATPPRSYSLTDVR
jgi:hypothetical protein